MATRSRIAIEKEDGTVESIYCHWDGYPEYNGRILVENYKDHEKVQALIDLGAISSLAPNVEADPDTRHTFNDPVGGVVVAYGRDRGETGVNKKSHGSVPDFFNGDIEEYGYLFTQEGQWLVKSWGRDNQPCTVEDYLKIDA
jgi:hypothetical protein